MDRKDFLKGIGLAGLGAMLPAAKTEAALGALSASTLSPGTCVLIPAETAGPFPLNLSGNSSMFRQDITEGIIAIPLELTLRIVNINDPCAPMPNVRVDIWHCDVDGYYSGFNVSSWLGPRNLTGQTFLRGIQISDLNGEVRFTTIYPGWYPGRAVHMHFQVFINSVLSATSQLCFPDNINTIVNNTAPYAAHGQNPTTNSSDGIFSDLNNTQYQVVTIAANGTGGYNASLIVGISGPVSTGLLELEPETGGQFRLFQNTPNPVSDKTTIPFRLNEPARVKIELFGLDGKKVAGVFDERLPAGDHRAPIDLKNISRSRRENLAYQVTVENKHGIFRQAKLMTVR